MRAKRYRDVEGKLHRSRRRAKYWSGVALRKRARWERSLERRCGFRFLRGREAEEACAEAAPSGYVGNMWGVAIVEPSRVRMKNPGWPKHGPRWLGWRTIWKEIKMEDSARVGG